MPRRYVNNSPAVRFLNRGDHLMRLQGRVIKPMLADTTAEHEQIKSVAISAATDKKQFVRDTVARMKATEERREDIGLMFQLFFCRYVDNFQIFLEELISDAVRADPRLVDGVKLRKADDGLSAEEKLARRIQKLSFMSLSELIETLATLMNFQLFPTPELAARVAYLYDVRNLFTHNYGVIDTHFQKRHRERGAEVGAIFPLDHDFINDAFIDLSNASGDIQTRACERFDLSYRTTVEGKTEWWET